MNLDLSACISTMHLSGFDCTYRVGGRMNAIVDHDAPPLLKNSRPFSLPCPASAALHKGAVRSIGHGLDKAIETTRMQPKCTLNVLSSVGTGEADVAVR